VLLVLLLGHGSGEGPGSKVNLPGPDATASEYAAWIAGFSRQTVVFVNAATGSGDFVPVLEGPGRVIVTATRSAVEKNESVFAGFFAKALSTDESDADKDSRVSVLEAFRYATHEVVKTYETSGRLQTEHARISDSTRATTVSFGKTAVSTDPRITALIAERQALESDVAALRARKASMAAADYDRELERLLLAIAEKTQAIRAAGGKP
jgi:chorismate mutase